MVTCLHRNVMSLSRYSLFWIVFAVNILIFFISSPITGWTGHYRMPFTSVSKRVSWLNHSCETVFRLQVHFHANQTYFYKKGFAQRLALKRRHKVTRKVPYSAMWLHRHPNDFCARIEWNLTALSARCYVTRWAVENLSTLQGIVWNLK